jgi:hypothetical protein
LRCPSAARLLVLGAVAAAVSSWRSLGVSFVPASPAQRLGASATAEARGARVTLEAATKAAAAGGKIIESGETIYLKVHTGRYVGEIDGTTKKEWVKARGTKKDKEHALVIEKKGGGEIESGDTVYFVMSNGAHMDVLGSAVRVRYYDMNGQWQKITIIKQEGGKIKSGDTIFLRGHQGEYIDANPLEKASDGEVKARWRDEGDWQVMTIET